jgi:thiamine-phosphate pyrophosphorylase
MSELEALWRAARTLPGAVRDGKRLPSLLFVTDPERVSDPVAVAERLPEGAGVVYRAFGRAEAERTGRALAEVARRRKLTLLVGADPDLTREIGADGVHLPERDLGRAAELRKAEPGWWLTTAVHGEAGLRAAEVAGVDAALVSPVFPTRSGAGRPVLGAETFERWAGASTLPLYALGGVTAARATELSGAAGLAAVDAFTS